MCLSIHIFLPCSDNANTNFTNLIFGLFVDVIMIYLLQLNELNIKQGEYWLRSLQTTYSFSFRYLKRTLYHSLNIYYTADFCCFVICIANPVLITHSPFQSKLVPHFPSNRNTRCCSLSVLEEDELHSTVPLNVHLYDVSRRISLYNLFITWAITCRICLQLC